jgi:hypothetical protein
MSDFYAVVAASETRPVAPSVEAAFKTIIPAGALAG